VTGSPERRATIADVARVSGVSRTTVSNALTGTGRVDPGTRSHVEAVAQELGYRPSLRAQRLRRGQSRTIGVVSSMPAAVAAGPARLGFYMEVAAAAAETALGRGFALVLTPPAADGLSLELLDIDGAIVVEPQQDDPVTTTLQARGVSLVALGGQPGRDLPHVDLDGERVAGLLLDHLYEQGARHIALMVGNSSRRSYAQARASYEPWAAAHQMPAIVTAAPEEEGSAGGHDAFVRLMRNSPEVDAVCAVVDAFAVGCVTAARELGLSVPDDVLVATRYDGLLARTCEPPLTAVDLHLGDLATRAVDLLLALLGGEPLPEAGAPTTPDLVPRGSSLRSGRAAVRP
jgi:DNA-binding LacI/PurR family transcriptional regulator